MAKIALNRKIVTIVLQANGETRRFSPLGMLCNGFFMRLHIAIEKPANHALVLCVVLCCFRLEKVHAPLAESQSNLLHLLPEMPILQALAGNPEQSGSCQWAHLGT